MPAAWSRLVKEGDLDDELEQAGGAEQDIVSRRASSGRLSTGAPGSRPSSASVMPKTSPNQRARLQFLGRRGWVESDVVLGTDAHPGRAQPAQPEAGGPRVAPSATECAALGTERACCTPLHHGVLRSKPSVERRWIAGPADHASATQILPVLHTHRAQRPDHLAAIRGKV